MASNKHDKTTLDVSQFPLPRRRLLRGGLAGFAAALVAPSLPGCGDDSMPTDAGVDAASDAGVDTGIADTGMDAGSYEFPERVVPERPALRSLIADIGPLGEPDADGMRLPEGFTKRALATSEEMVPGTDYVWHYAPDGGATFMTEDGGFIYVSNSEAPLIGGVGAMRFDASGAFLDAYPILTESNLNCAGGPTPWHTWLSCEESGNGKVFECDPWGEHDPVVRLALGILKHEAVTVDPVRNHLYLTEDQEDGGFYRYVPDGMTPLGRPNLEAGSLEIAQVDESGNITWLTVPEPEMGDIMETRYQVEGSTPFDGGEGIWYHDGIVYFSTKGDTRIWAYDVETLVLSVLYDGEAIADPPLRGVDNVTVSCCGDVLVAEDGGSMQIVAILPSGELKPLMQIVGQDSSEITGPAFDPSGTRLFFSSQRGTDGAGITYVVEGPFHAPA